MQDERKPSTGPFVRFLKSFYSMEVYGEAANEPLARGVRFLLVVFLALFILKTAAYEGLVRRGLRVYISQHGAAVSEALAGFKFSATEPNVTLQGELALKLTASGEPTFAMSNAPEGVAEPDKIYGLVVDPTGITYRWDKSQKPWRWRPEKDSTFALEPNGLRDLAAAWACRDMTDLDVPADWKNARLVGCPAVDLIPLGSLRLGIGTLWQFALGRKTGQSIDLLGSAVPGFKAAEGRLTVEPSYPVWERVPGPDMPSYTIRGKTPLLRFGRIRREEGFVFASDGAAVLTKWMPFTCPYPEEEITAEQVIEELSLAAPPFYEVLFTVAEASALGFLAFALVSATLLAFVGGLIASGRSQTRLGARHVAAIAFRAGVPGLIVAVLVIALVFFKSPIGSLAALVGLPALYGGLATRRVAESEEFNLLAPPPGDD